MKTNVVVRQSLTDLIGTARSLRDCWGLADLDELEGILQEVAVLCAILSDEARDLDVQQLELTL